MSDRESSKEAALARVQKSKLLFKIQPHQLPIVYHSIYNIGFFGVEKLHPFDAGKWGKIHDFLITEHIKKEEFVEPRQAQPDDLLVVHTKSYLNSLRWSAVVAGIL